MNFKKFVYLLLILFVGCSSLDYETYEGKKIEVDYLHKDGFLEGHWIEIDGIRFNHRKNMDDVSEIKNAIPTSKVVKDSLGPNKKFEADYNSISIAIMLGNRLKKLSETEQDSSENLLITNKPLLMTRGKLRIMKKDSSKFEVKSSQKYPATIEVLGM